MCVPVYSHDGRLGAFGSGINQQNQHPNRSFLNTCKTPWWTTIPCRKLWHPKPKRLPYLWMKVRWIKSNGWNLSRFWGGFATSPLLTGLYQTGNASRRATWTWPESDIDILTIKLKKVRGNKERIIHVSHQYAPCLKTTCRKKRTAWQSNICWYTSENKPLTAQKITPKPWTGY